MMASGHLRNRAEVAEKGAGGDSLTERNTTRLPPAMLRSLLYAMLCCLPDHLSRLSRVDVFRTVP